MLLSGLGAVRVVKNCNFRLENAALALACGLFKTLVTVFPDMDLPAGQ